MNLCRQVTQFRCAGFYSSGRKRDCKYFEDDGFQSCKYALMMDGGEEEECINGKAQVNVMLNRIGGLSNAGSKEE